MNSTRASSLVPLLVAWFTVVLPPVAGGQEFETHALNVGKYHRFGFFSWIRLSTDAFLDPTEARTADVRCFHELNHLNESQQDDVFQDVFEEDGNVSIGSNLDGEYYVIEPARVATGDWGGEPVTDIHSLPESLEILADVDVIDELIDELKGHLLKRADSLPTPRQGTISAPLDSQVFGVVTSDPDAFPEIPCERIVNWTGETETVGHIGWSP